MNKIDLGFVEESESWRLESRFVPSKVGGKPAWLNLRDLPSSTDVQCDSCNNSCIFLCQIYAPFEEDPQAFHRTLYIFICREPTCCKTNDNKNLKVLRSQLPRKNPFYPFDAPEEEEENWRVDIRAENWVKTCQVCGLLAPKHCSACKKINYCCREHQVYDWKAGHKRKCNAAPKEQKNKEAHEPTKILFPEYEIVMETEEYDTPDNPNDSLAKEVEQMNIFQSLVNSGKAGTLQSEKDVDTDLQNMSQAENDEVFSSFTERVKLHPDQILRYDRGGTPLYISADGKPPEIPKCQECSGERQFEFQVMPQLLNYLDFENPLTSLDWGTLLIYTCKNSCVSKSGYTLEYIWKQDITSPSPTVVNE